MKGRAHKGSHCAKNSPVNCVGCFFLLLFCSNILSNVFSPTTIESSEGVSLPLSNSKDFILSLDIKFVSNGSLSVLLETTEKGPPFIIHYVTNMQLIAFKDREITYGIGPRSAWTTLTRDLLTDLRKGVGLSNTKAVKATKVPVRCLISFIKHCSDNWARNNSYKIDLDIMVITD